MAVVITETTINRRNAPAVIEPASSAPPRCYFTREETGAEMSSI
jgi:hypothetical protein